MANVWKKTTGKAAVGNLIAFDTIDEWTGDECKSVRIKEEKPIIEKEKNINEDIQRSSTTMG